MELINAVLFVLQKTQATVADKSFAVGTLAECLDAMGPASAPFAQHLYPLFVMMTQDQDEEVRSNAVFATGILAVNAGEVMHAYPSWLCVFGRF